MTHLSRPAPAVDLFCTASGVKSGFMYLLIFEIWAALMPSFSKFTKLFRKFGSASIVLDAAQLMPESFRPGFLRISTQSMTFFTSGGGCEKDLISVMCSFCSEPSACAAASSAGMASASIVSASSFCWAICTFSTPSDCSFASADACFSSTCVVFSVITSRSSLHSVVFASTTSFASESSMVILSTPSAAWISFTRPPFRRSASSPMRVRFVPRLRL
mmetsp:Transcript_2862/g.10102  ORF Transcript_2862/g.10102 Transcript_2862/m.10102 type:complete len:217 (-) Transcript_2862:3456-4106(-)